jgi:hypothetical protein
MWMIAEERRRYCAEAIVDRMANFRRTQLWNRLSYLIILGFHGFKLLLAEVERYRLWVYT